MYALKWNPLFFIVMNLFNCKKFSNDYKPEACRCVLCQKEWIEMLETIVPAFTAPSVMGFSLYDQSRTETTTCSSVLARIYISVCVRSSSIDFV